MDDVGAVVAEHRRLPADDVTLLGWLAALPGPVTVAMEATRYWAWRHERLTAAGFAAVAAHPSQGKLIWQARAKTDPIDARKLAELLRVNRLPTIWVPDADVLARRKLLRGRAYLVRMRTRMKHRIHGDLTAEHCRCLVTDLYGKAGRAWLRAVTLPEITRVQVDLLLELIDAVDARVKRLDHRIRKTVAQDAGAERLQTVPGIGPFGALLLLAEIGHIDRFASSHQLAAYAGLGPSTRSSGDKTAHGGVDGAGSPWRKWVLIESVQTLKLAPGPLGRQYQRLRRSTGKAKATMAAARKLCCDLYWMLREAWTDEDWLPQHEELGVRPEHALVSVA